MVILAKEFLNQYVRFSYDLRASWACMKRDGVLIMQ